MQFDRLGTEFVQVMRITVERDAPAQKVPLAVGHIIEPDVVSYVICAAARDREERIVDVNVMPLMMNCFVW
jgi:hypothetical protein